MVNYDIELVHISDIMVGDTIFHNGELKTVCKSNISRVEGMGATLFGDCYQLGHKKVKKAVIYHAKSI